MAKQYSVDNKRVNKSCTYCTHQQTTHAEMRHDEYPFCVQHHRSFSSPFGWIRLSRLLDMQVAQQTILPSFD